MLFDAPAMRAFRYSRWAGNEPMAGELLSSGFTPSSMSSG
jgi:hypothetical protein